MQHQEWLKSMLRVMSEFFAYVLDSNVSQVFYFENLLSVAEKSIKYYLKEIFS